MGDKHVIFFSVGREIDEENEPDVDDKCEFLIIFIIFKILRDFALVQLKFSNIDQRIMNNEVERYSHTPN